MNLDVHALILGLTLGLFPAVHAGTGLCPNPNTLTGRPDPGHFHLITGDEDKDAVPLPCNSCEDPNNAEFSACLSTGLFWLAGSARLGPVGEADLHDGTPA